MMSVEEQKEGYSFDFPEGNELSKENIFSRVSELMLWRYYLGKDFALGKAMSAPYRQDTSPSFNIFWSERYRKYMFVDFGEGLRGDFFDFMKLCYGLNYYQILTRINRDFNLKLGGRSSSLQYQASKKEKEVVSPKISYLRNFEKEAKKKKPQKTSFSSIHRPPLKEDLEYWNQFGISRSTLRKFNVYCVRSLYMNDLEIYSYAPGDPCYEYRFPSGNRKYYRPFSKKGKFIGNISNSTDIQGYYQCRVKEKYENKFLILTKSMKDCMVLHEYGIDAMAIHGETQKFDPDFIRHLKKYYPFIVSLYDRDTSGITGSKYLWKEYGIIPFFINKRKYGSKDISDLYKEKGKEQTEEFLNNIRQFINNKKQKS